MSIWTHVFGTVMVSPMGRTQPEKRYILDTVLEHLPRVTGDEGDMEIYVNQVRGDNVSSTCDEFGMRTNNLVTMYGDKSRYGMHRTQDYYLLTVEGNLRRRNFDDTKKELLKWLCRLAKRVQVDHVLISLQCDWPRKEWIIKDYCKAFYNMFEEPSWSSDYVKDEKSRDFEGPNWCEYLMWDRGHDSDMPMMLVYKYYSEQENDEEVTRRMALWKT